MATEREKHSHSFLKGGGEMGELTRAYDWASTSLGSPDQWPQALRLTISIILKSRFPMFLWWGNDMVQFYNDAYRPSLGNTGKHPAALGQKAKDCWPEIWDIIYPLIRQVRTTGEATWSEDQLIPIYRNGAIEDVYWTFGYSPVENETGEIEGVLVICNETTNKVKAFQAIAELEQRLNISELNLKNIIMQSPVAMAILKGEKHLVEIANDRMYRLWGKSQKEMLNRPVFDSLTEARREGFEDLLTQVYRTGETFTSYGAAVTLYREGKEELVYVHFVYEAFRNPEGIISGVMVVATEVTEEILNLKKLQQSQQEIRTIVENAPFPIAVYRGPEMKIELANQSIIDVWGKGQDVIGKTYFEILPELDSQGVYPILRNVYAAGEPFNVRNQRVDLTVNGVLRQFYFNYSFTPLFDASGKPNGVMNTAADVTDMNVAKQKVEKSERNFRNFLNQAPVAMCIMTGPEFIVEVANKKMIELWGKQPEEVMFKPIFEGLPDARNQGLEKLISDVYTTGIPFYASELPVELLRNGKKEVVYQNFAYEPYRDSNGSILGVVAITIDVTEQVMARLKIEDVVKERTESLRKSNEELSQFAYIASHDLQEPLRKITTFTEMLESHSTGMLDEKSQGYLSKINSASIRMNTLIRDVLNYSQLSGENEAFVQVNLNRIVDAIVTDFDLLIEQTGAKVNYNDLPTIQAVPLQMTQLFGNLIGNALKFRRKEVAPQIVITCKKRPGKSGISYYEFKITDNGIGFLPEQADQIFNIFKRLHNKSQYAGTGIGLAMCKKIVLNHQGDIDASESSTKGAVFKITLPEGVTNKKVK